LARALIKINLGVITSVSYALMAQLSSSHKPSFVLQIAPHPIMLKRRHAEGGDCMSVAVFDPPDWEQVTSYVLDNA